MADEGALIKRIARMVPSRTGQGRGLAKLGIGDDAAILSTGRRADWLVSSDAFVDGVHFVRQVHSPDSVGFKALARATSDLAAMGAKPEFFMMTLVLPKGLTGTWLDGLLLGLRRAARSLGMRLIGGDTTAGKIASVSLTVFGQIEAGKAVMRSGGQPGDQIYVSGRLGEAALGLELALEGFARKKGAGGWPGGARPTSVLQAHLYPRIRVALGSWLAAHRIASAMMDISDGLSIDLARLCEASGVGAKLWADRIPTVAIPPTAARRLRHKRLDPLQMALHGGDDYELLFTIPRRNESRLRKAPGFRELVCIGALTRDRRVMIIEANGQQAALNPRGWDPFR